ncbi:unnamed protein product [Closterium sp. Naga37s-1]|nr:unnamed protein product [Closterium sp. Naga37s-1]
MLPHAAFPHRAGATAPSKSALLVNPQGSKVPTTQGSPCFLPRYPLRIISASRTLSAVPTLSAFPAFSASRSPFSYSCTPAFPLKLRRSQPLRHLSHWRTPHLPAPARASDSGGRTGGGADAGGDGAESGDGGARAGGVTADAAAGDNGGFWATVSSAMQSMADVVTQAQRELLEGEYSAGTPWLDDDDVSLLHSQITPYNFIKVVEVSRRADNSLAGSRVLLLDQPGNIHSMHFKYKPWTGSYYDLFTLLPPLLPSSSGPIAILGLAAGTGARLLLRHYPHLELHGWEIDEHVIQVARTYFDLEELEDGSFAAQELRPYVPFSDSDTDRGVGGEKEREQAEGGGVAREWEEEWRARVPAELEGKVGQWMPLGRFMEAQRRRMREELVVVQEAQRWDGRLRKGASEAAPGELGGGERASRGRRRCEGVGGVAGTGVGRVGREGGAVDAAGEIHGGTTATHAGESNCTPAVILCCWMQQCWAAANWCDCGMTVV